MDTSCFNKDFYDKFQNYFQLVDEFDYDNNTIQATKDFIKFLLFDLLWKFTKK